MSERTGARTLAETFEESKEWAAQGFTDAGTLELYARSLHKAPGHAYDIGRYAMRGVLATSTYYKAMTNMQADAVVPHHLIHSMDIFQKSVIDEQLRPGMSQEEFLDHGGEPWRLLEADEWVVATGTLRDVYRRLDTNVGQFVIDNELKKLPLENFGYDERQVLEYAALLGSVARRAA